MRKLYYDTASADSEGSMAALRVMAPLNHIMYGSDYPFVKVAEGIKHIQENEISEPTAPQSIAAMPLRCCRGLGRHNGCCRHTPFPAVQQPVLPDWYVLLSVRPEAWSRTR